MNIDSINRKDTELSNAFEKISDFLNKLGSDPFIQVSIENIENK